jgi:catechol-2,3-dioxygenase
VIIRQVQLQTDQPGALRAFYADSLGMPLVSASHQTVSLQAGTTRLIFSQGAPAIYHFAFNIPQNQFDQARQWLAQRAALLTWDGVDYVHWHAWNAHAVYCLDPAGSVIELIARHNLPNDSHAPFSGSSLLNISEIGLAAPDVPALSAYLQKEAGLPVWDAGDSASFTALGDDHGLLIIVQRGRPWFPTDDHTADYHPVSLALAGTHSRTIRMTDLPYQIDVQTG